MSDTQKFLVIDRDADGRVLLVRTLMRVFPQCAVMEVQDFESALKLIQTDAFDAIVCHRAIGADGETLVRAIRAINASIPVLGVSGTDRTQAFLDAGATRFLSYDEWLRAGTVVSEILSGSISKSKQDVKAGAGGKQGRAEPIC